MKRLTILALLTLSLFGTAQAHYRWGMRYDGYGPYKIWGNPQVGYVASYVGGANQDSCVWVYVSGGTPPDSVKAGHRAWWLMGSSTDSLNKAGLLGRANHTGTQLKSTISDFAHSHSPTDITGTAVITSDSRLSDARTPTAHNQAISTVTALQESLNVKAPATHSHIKYTALANGTTAMAFGTNTTVKVTPTATASYTTTIAPAGTPCELIILTSGTTSYTITFSTGFKAVSTLATGTTTAKTFTVSFISDGTNMIETCRTAAH